MYTYIKGIITEIYSGYVVLESNGIGYQIYTANPYFFKIDKEYKIYIYQNVKEDELTLYGFKDNDERELFLKLISVKGLGCKMALPMFALDSLSNIVNAIENNDISYLKKFPKIGDKIARQIILDLKGKLVSNGSETSNKNEELGNALKALGYKNTEIKTIIQKVDINIPIEKQIKEALKLMLK